MEDAGSSKTQTSRRREEGQPALGRVLFVVLVICILASGFYFARKSGTNAEVYSNDFNVYYHAAREIVEGRDPYQHSLGDWTPYLYPPLLAELIIPLALLPLPVAAYVWFLINAASVIAAAWMSATLAADNSTGDSAPGHAASRVRAVIAVSSVIIVLRFVLDNLSLGQVNAMVAALAVAHVYLFTRGKKSLSAIALVAAASIKLTPALLLLYHIAKLRLRFSAACLALFVAVTALSFLPFGGGAFDAFRLFSSRTVRNEQGYDFAYAGNQSLRGAVARVSKNWNEGGESNQSRMPTDMATLVISMLFVALAILVAVRAGTEAAAAAPFFCCMVLLSPLSWKAHFVVLILPCAYLLSRVKTPTRVRYFILGMLVAVFVLFNMTGPRVIGLAAAEWSDAHSLVFAGALLIFGASGATVLTRKFGKPPHVC